MTGMAIGWPSPTLPLLFSEESPLPLTSEEASWMVSAIYIGNLFSPLPCGKLMETIGRKKTLLYVDSIPLISWFLIIVTKNAYVLYFARFLSGLWLGIVYTVVPIYLAEIAQTGVRGVLCAFFGLMTYVGVFFVYIVGPYCSYDILAFISLLFCVIFYFSFSLMPETPYFYAKIGKMEEAKASLSWLRGDNPNVDEELASIQASIELQIVNKGTILDLIRIRANRRAFFTVGMLSMFQKFSGIGAIIAYASITLPKDGVVGVSVDGCLMILGFIWVSSTLLSSLFVDKVGRKVLLIISSLGCAISSFLAAVWLYLNEMTSIDVSSFNWVPFVCLCVHGFSFSIGLNPLVTTIKGEMFPANIKGIASAITTIMLALASIFINKSYQMFADNIGMYFNFLLYSICSTFAVFFTYYYVIETRGKSLKEIQDKLNGVRHEDESDP